MKDKKPTFMVDGVEVDANGKPVAEAEKAVDSTAESDSLRQQLAEAHKERDSFKEDMLTAQREKHEQNQFADRERNAVISEKEKFRLALMAKEGEHHALKADLETANEQLEKERVGRQSIIADHQQRIRELEGERNTLTSQLTDVLARPVLPTDAHARLVKINGVAEKLAGQILDALKTDPITEGK